MRRRRPGGELGYTASSIARWIGESDPSSNTHARNRCVPGPGARTYASRPDPCASFPIGSARSATATRGSSWTIAVRHCLGGMEKLAASARVGLLPEASRVGAQARGSTRLLGLAAFFLSFPSRVWPAGRSRCVACRRTLGRLPRPAGRPAGPRAQKDAAGLARSCTYSAELQ
jgi:hypothetical protein